MTIWKVLTCESSILIFPPQFTIWRRIDVKLKVHVLGKSLHHMELPTSIVSIFILVSVGSKIKCCCLQNFSSKISEFVRKQFLVEQKLVPIPEFIRFINLTVFWVYFFQININWTSFSLQKYYSINDLLKKISKLQKIFLMTLSKNPWSNRILESCAALCKLVVSKKKK